MIESLLCVTNSRPDVIKEFGIVTRFQYTPREAHVQKVKRILRYLNGIVGLWYPKGENPALIVYTHDDWI